MEAKTMVQVASVVTGVLSGSATGALVAAGAKEHSRERVSVGGGAFAGALIGLGASLIPAVVFGKLLSQQEPAVGLLAAERW